MTVRTSFNVFKVQHIPVKQVMKTTCKQGKNPKKANWLVWRFCLSARSLSDILCIFFAPCSHAHFADFIIYCAIHHTLYKGMKKSSNDIHDELYFGMSLGDSKYTNENMN